MPTYDPQKAAQVWQRVNSHRAEAQTEDRAAQLPELIMNEWTAAVTYLQLARQMQPREAAVLQRLYREEQAHMACLKGIYTLITGEKAVIRAPQPAVESPERTLRQCYGGEMRSLREYERLSEDPEYGHVFRKLAQQEQEHCRAVLELIGGLKGK